MRLRLVLGMRPLRATAVVKGIALCGSTIAPVLGEHTGWRRSCESASSAWCYLVDCRDLYTQCVNISGCIAHDLHLVLAVPSAFCGAARRADYVSKVGKSVMNNEPRQRRLYYHAMQSLQSWNVSSRETISTPANVTGRSF